MPLRRTRPDLASFGTPGAPTSGVLKCTVTPAQGPVARIDITLNKARVPVTDAAASGSSGSLKLLDMIEGAFAVLGCRMDFTSFVEGAALTTAAGDAAFVMALGTAAADAGDGALTGTEVDVCAATSTITLSSGTGTGSKLVGAASTALDGTAAAKAIYLNWSGTAATIDANSYIDVTGTISLLVAQLGDD